MSVYMHVFAMKYFHFLKYVHCVTATVLMQTMPQHYFPFTVVSNGIYIKLA